MTEILTDFDRTKLVNFMNLPVNRIFTPHHIDYLILNETFQIQAFSAGTLELLPSSQTLNLNEDIRYNFPELIGTEDVLRSVLSGEQASFDLKGISRIDSQGNTLYLDLYVMQSPQENIANQLIVYLENVTEKMALEQKLVQATNELALLLNSLKSSEQYIHQIISSMADPLLIADRLGIIKKINPAGQKLFGYTEAELLNQPITLLFGTENLLLRVIHQYGGLKEGEVLKDLELDCRTKTGEKLAIAFSCAAIHANGIEQYSHPQKDFIYVGRDITKTQQAQQRLVAQYTATHILSEAATLDQALPKLLPALCKSLEWQIAEFWLPENPITENLTCMTLGTAPGVKISPSNPAEPQQKLAHQVWQTQVPEWIDIATQNGMQTALGLPILAKQEILGVIVLLSRDRRLQDEQLLQTLVAISYQLGQFIKRKHTEKALIESEANLAEAQRLAHVGSWELDVLSQKMSGSDEFFRILGLNPQAFFPAYSDYLEYIHPDDRRLWETAVHQALTQGQPYELDFRIVRRDRTIRYLNGRGKAISHLQNTALRLIGTVIDITERKQAEIALSFQKKQTDSLLQNILPTRIAELLKTSSGAIAENFDEVSVLFADIVGFTELSTQMPATQLVQLLNLIFSKFDRLTEQHNLEKIKTIGDAYMVVGGLPLPHADHASAIAQIALDMLDAISEFNAQTHQSFNIRIGIHTGPVVAGVIGTKKFIYDLWGDTVNIASRMESHGLAGSIQVSRSTYELLKQTYHFAPRGRILVKGKGQMDTYLLIGRKSNKQPESTDKLE